MDTPKQNPFGKRYKIMEEIGKGGMGKVYKVHDSVKDVILALKEMDYLYAASSSATLRFKNEFRAMSQFNHPNTVQVFDFGISRENVPFITMEFIDGEDLSKCYPMKAEDVVNVLSQICKALSYIHSRLYVHRDLKPENIKVLKHNAIKLMDYGLMSQLGEPASKSISGTYHYLAPEVITGGIIDESTDLYSVGIIGYELLTGKRPFTGKSKEILQGHLKKVPMPPTTLLMDIPAALNAIIMKLLEKEKEKRYRNAVELLEDLQYFTGQQEILETSAQKEGYLYSTRLVGREKEVQFFKKCLQKEQSMSMFIGAPAGMGKSRLLNELKNSAALEGLQNLNFSCRDMGGQAYAWLETLIQQMLILSEESLVQQYGAQLAWFSKNLSQKFGSPDLPPDESQIIASILAWLKAITAESPLALFIDDLHLLDLESVKVFNAIIRAQGQIPGQILVIANFRNNELEKSSPAWYTVEEGITHYFVLASFDRRQTQILIENLLYPTAVSQDFLTYCFHNCGGNVFDLIELLRYLISEGYLTRSKNRWHEPVDTHLLQLSGTWEERLLTRIKHLQPQVRGLADVASVFEQEWPLEKWQEVAGYQENDFFTAIEELIKRQIIVKNEDYTYQFSHDKVRSLLYNNLDHARKQEYHFKLAKILESQYTDGESPALIARHFTLGKAGQSAIKFSLLAAGLAEDNKAEWAAFEHYKNAVNFLQDHHDYPARDEILLDIHERVSLFTSAAWMDAGTCLQWLQKAIDHYSSRKDIDKVFSLSLSYIVTSSITANYEAARRKLSEITEFCNIQANTLKWAVLYGAGVCLTDWYQGYQRDCFEHASKAIAIFESQQDNLPQNFWPPYSWAIFWRDKARAYLGEPIDMQNIEKIRQLMLAGKSDKVIYWHTLTAVGARAAFTGRYKDLIDWKQTASKLSRELGKIYWFECWISHSYVYGCLDYGDFSQINNHIERVKASPDPYQVNLAHLFAGRYCLNQQNYLKAEENLKIFLEREEQNMDNSYLEGLIYLGQTYLESGQTGKARYCIEKGYNWPWQGNTKIPCLNCNFRI